FFEGWLGGEPSEAKMRSNLGGALAGVVCEYRVWASVALVGPPDHLSGGGACRVALRISGLAFGCPGAHAGSSQRRRSRLIALRRTDGVERGGKARRHPPRADCADAGHRRGL